MTDKLSDGIAPGSAEQDPPNPNSPASGPARSDSDAPAWFIQYTEQVERRFKELDQTARSAQGNARQTESEFRKWMSRVEQLESQGKSREDAIATIERDQQSNEWQTSIERQLKDIASLVQRGGNASSGNSVVATVLDEFGLDPKDPYIATQMRDAKITNRVEAEAFAGRMLRDKSASPQPNPAQSSTSPASGNAKMDQSDIENGYLEEIAKVPRGNIRHAANVKSKWREIARKAGYNLNV